MTVYRRKDGRWCARVCIAGRRLYFYGSSKRKAQEKAEEFLRQLGLRSSVPQPGRHTLQDLLESYLQNANLKPRTVKDYRDVSRHLRPIMNVPLRNLSAEHVLLVLRPLRDKARTALKVYRTLHRLCEFGRQVGWLGENACDRIPAPKYAPTPRKVWSVEELTAFLQEASRYRLGALFWVLAFGGLRIGEALALTWEDVDLERGTLQVRRTVQRVGGRWVFGEPKSKAGYRQVALPASAVSVLKQHRRKRIEATLRQGRPWDEGGLVFCGPQGEPVYQQTVLAAMKSIARRAGVPPVTPHSLRHGVASMLLEAGVPLPAVSAKLGHASVHITARIYAHNLQDDHRSAEALSRILRLGLED